MRTTQNTSKTAAAWETFQTFPVFFLFLVEWIVCGNFCTLAQLWVCLKYNNDCYVQLQLRTLAYSERWRERVSHEKYFEMSPSRASRSQFGGPRLPLSSWVSLCSLPWTCSAPTRWAVSMAVMSRWAYLMEPSSGREIRQKKTFVFLLCVTCSVNQMSHLSLPELHCSVWPCINWITLVLWPVLHW